MVLVTEAGDRCHLGLRKSSRMKESSSGDAGGDEPTIGWHALFSGKCPEQPENSTDRHRDQVIEAGGTGEMIDDVGAGACGSGGATAIPRDRCGRPGMGQQTVDHPHELGFELGRHGAGFRPTYRLMHCPVHCPEGVH